ncbi:UDP-N-acetylmuramoyl-tripeptide--D-alanyl-D-alanine ligase [compost metagenome]
MSGERVTCFPNADTAVRFVNEAVRPGDLLLLKGSRGMGLERIAEALVPRMRLAV